MIARLKVSALAAFGALLAAASSGHAQNYEGAGLLYSGVFLQGSRTLFDIDGPEFAEGTASGNGLGGGVSLGYDFRWKDWLIGIEGDVSVEDGGAAKAGRSYTLGYIATIRGRLGVYAHPNLLLYATAGYGAVGAEFQVGTPGEDSIFKVNESVTGLVAGGGVELDLYHFTVFGEYLYGNFGSFSFVRPLPAIPPEANPEPGDPTGPVQPPPERYTVNVDQHLFRIGVRFKMGHDHYAHQEPRK